MAREIAEQKQMLMTETDSGELKLTSEEWEDVVYAIKREAEEEGVLLEECRMISRNKKLTIDDMKKLLGISDERQKQIFEMLEEDTNLQEVEWQELLKRHGLPWKKSDFPKSYQRILRTTVEKKREDAKVLVRFRMLINGRKEGLTEEDYKELIEIDGYQFSEFEHLIKGYGDKIEERLVRKFRELQVEQDAIKRWKEEQKQHIKWKLICIAVIMLVVLIFQTWSVSLFAGYILFLMVSSDSWSKPIATI